MEYLRKFESAELTGASNIHGYSGVCSQAPALLHHLAELVVAGVGCGDVVEVGLEHVEGHLIVGAWQ